MSKIVYAMKDEDFVDLACLLSKAEVIAPLQHGIAHVSLSTVFDWREKTTLKTGCGALLCCVVSFRHRSWGFPARSPKTALNGRRQHRWTEPREERHGIQEQDRPAFAGIDFDN